MKRFACFSVFNNENAEFFILNDIFLPSYPLAIEWLNFDPKSSENPGHFAAVGSMTNKIDIWDLNVTGVLEPAYSLGGKKAKGVKHKDAVIDLAWNEATRYYQYTLHEQEELVWNF